MRRGFLATVLAIVLVLSVSRELAVYGKLFSGVQGIKNDIWLGSRINEETYGLEEGFTLTVKEALGSMPPIPPSKEYLADEYVCGRVMEWFKSYPDYSLYIGYIDPSDYSLAPAIGVGIEPCLNFLHVDLADRAVSIKDNGLIDFPYPLAGYRIAFLFRGSVQSAGFIAIIPEGVTIK